MSLSIRKVSGRSDKIKFIKSQWNFYKDDPNFVPPIIFDRLNLLNTEKNPFYKHAEIELFLAEREGQIAGRIAAITNEYHNSTHNDKVGFFGFFECENNEETANALFDTAEAWLKERGMDTIRGPVNPSMNDETAFLCEGFDRPPLILMPYNPPYYNELAEKCGFVVAKNLYAYLLNGKSYMKDKLKRLQEVVRKRWNITVREVDLKNKEQFLRDVKTLKDIYNSAWVPNWGFVKMTDEEFDYLANDFKQFADQDYAIIVEIDGKPAGFALALPNLNDALIYNKRGSLLGALWHMFTKKKKVSMVRIIVLGVDPKYQRTGADAVIYYELGKRTLANGIIFAEASWILEDNEMMNKGLTQTMNADRYKTYRIYEKKID